MMGRETEVTDSTTNGKFALHHGDCMDVLKAIADESVDSIVTDPPYELGFMGKGWDASGIANDAAMWAECLRVLKPGGHLLAFSGSRTYHRMVCAIEDGGFEVRDQIMWLYGSGFPKSMDVSKAIDKAAGAEREVIGSKSAGASSLQRVSRVEQGYRENLTNCDTAAIDITAPATDAARQWSGWGTALKPAHEPVCVARKPFAGTVAGNVLEHGTGALNIDGCRVRMTIEQAQDRAVAFELSREGEASAGRRYTESGSTNFAPLPGVRGGDPAGRWPANVIHDGSPEVLEAFAQFGERGAAAPVKGTESSSASIGRVTGARARVPGEFHGDTGTAARFFYCAKASRADRNHGLEDPGPIHKHGVTLRQMENAVRDGVAKGNTHPTVKPTDLMAYLCRLVTPAGGVVLDPFMGSGSTGKAAMREGFRFIGIDMTPEYVEIARARIQFEAERVEQERVDATRQSDLFSEVA